MNFIDNHFHSRLKMKRSQMLMKTDNYLNT